MSARREVMDSSLLQSPDVTWSAERDIVSFPEGGWNPERFAHEQIQGLVRRVFLSNAMLPVRQVVFSAMEAETDVRSICRQVGEVLALETTGTVAVMGGFPRTVHDSGTLDVPGEETRPGTIPPLRRISTRVGGNLWLVPGAASDDRLTTASLHSYLGELRREFEFSIVAAAAGGSNETTAMAQFADGVILVLSAQRTRRVTARKVTQALEAGQARLLGTVLSDRLFPIPEGIYRRL
jgi:hypothetical protein